MHRITEVSIYRIEGVFLLNHPLASPCFYADLSTHLINQGPDRRDSSFVNTVPVSNFVYQNTTGSFFNRYRIDIRYPISTATWHILSLWPTWHTT